jgi:CBS domain-containing protein
MNIKIADVMAKRVISAQAHHTVEHVRALFERNRIHAVPVVGPDGEPQRIVTSADLARDLKSGTPVGQIMSQDVRTVPAYNDASVAARIMRKHRIHHIVVTHEKRVVGVVSSFDLLKLVEGHRFTVKGAPSTPKKKR